MARLRVPAFVLALVSAVPGVAEPGVQPDANASPLTGRLGGEAPFHIERRGFSFPVIDYVDQAGVRQQRRGIVAGRTIAPDTVLGLGFFETTPKSGRLIGDPGSMPRRSRKAAAIGLSMKF